VTVIRYYLPVGFCSQGCAGHPSKAEARKHYRQFLIDRCGQYSARLNSPAACVVCGRDTTFFAWIDYYFEWEIVALCPVHLNREELLSTFVLKDYHLLQISEPQSCAVATITGSDGWFHREIASGWFPLLVAETRAQPRDRIRSQGPERPALCPNPAKTKSGSRNWFIGNPSAKPFKCSYRAKLFVGQRRNARMGATFSALLVLF
jgi:hypothetical protein